MPGTLEQNIQELNNYLAQENTILKDNIKLERDINNIEGEMNRSIINYDRLSKMIFYLSIIAVVLFVYTIELDIMYPFRLIVNLLTGMAGRQLGLIIVVAVSLFLVLYLTKSSYSKIITSLTMTGLIYATFSKLFGVDLMGIPLFVTFLLCFYIFEF
jgi:hypothetical protein